MKQINAKILKNQQVGGDYRKMTLAAPAIARKIAPGQFVHVLCSNSAEPLLRRPFSMHRVSHQSPVTSHQKKRKNENSGTIEILYEIVGKGTEILSKKRSGEFLDIIGPLGNGFFIPKTVNRKPETSILIAGGMGVAPLVALAEGLVHSSKFIVHSKKKKREENIIVLIGAKTKNHILCEKDFKKLGAKVLVSTEDGSKGGKGLVTTQLDLSLSTMNYELSTIFACGPNPMLQAVSMLAAKYNIRCQVSLEGRMACGVGVCLGCPVKIKSTVDSPQSTERKLRKRDVSDDGRRTTDDGYMMVCKDGPVFDADRIDWEE
ncbi:MAG: dihydroorotate dehydrogenase electron transfer subunit [Candidatus Omnitrophota bacterium]